MVVSLSRAGISAARHVDLPALIPRAPCASARGAFQIIDLRDLLLEAALPLPDELEYSAAQPKSVLFGPRVLENIA